MAFNRPLYNGLMFLDVAQLSVSYTDRARPSVDRVTLSLRAGEMGVLIGPSGCGKTTLLRAVAGLERASAGEIRLAQSVVSSAAVHVAPEARRIGMVFQDYALFPHLTVHDNVSFGLHKQPRAEREAPAHIVFRTSYQVASNSASPWPALWHLSRNCCCWMSRSLTSMWNCVNVWPWKCAVF
jgi:ABC-type Fe3+/spermidine/putrescine transport system ATPase subunit